MGIEARIRQAETKEIVINDYMDLDEEDIRSGKQYTITIKKMSMKEQMDIYNKTKGGQEVSLDMMYRSLLYCVVEHPFEAWNKEKIEWLDKMNPELLWKIFQEISDFNRPLAMEK